MEAGMVASCGDERTRRLSGSESGDSEKLKKLHVFFLLFGFLKVDIEIIRREFK